MRSCEEIRELVPWYVEGRLSAEESVAVARHVAECTGCVREVADIVSLRAAVRAGLDLLECDTQALWERVERQAMGRRLAQLDVGSFLVGLRLGAWLTRRGAPVHADLRLLGREVRLIDRRKGGRSK